MSIAVIVVACLFCIEAIVASAVVITLVRLLWVMSAMSCCCWVIDEAISLLMRVKTPSSRDREFSECWLTFAPELVAEVRTVASAFCADACCWVKRALDEEAGS